MRHFIFMALSLFMLGHMARAEDASSCWSGTIKTDFRTGKSTFTCVGPSDASLKISQLRQLAEMGYAGRKDAAVAVNALKDENWDVRAEAARAIGLIGYAAAVPDLVAAISPNDWRLTFEAMLSLSSLKAPRADAVLASIKDSYWLPSVAEAARNLAEGHPERVPRFSMMDDFPTDFCNAKVDPALIPKCALNDGDLDRHNAENKAYYRTFWRSFRDQPSLRGAQKATTLLEAPDGTFIGSNYGEWGGQLGFGNEKTSYPLIDENVVAVIRRGQRIFAVTGLNHGGLNQGYIWEVSRSEKGPWSARRIRRLPGTPIVVVVAPDGTIGLYGPFGSVLFKTDDTLQWLACGPASNCRMSTR